MKNLSVILIIVLLLSGCFSSRQQVYQSFINAGYSESYAQGFAEGQESGSSAGGSVYSQFIKDVNRTQSDFDYAMGWEDGFRDGKGKQDAVSRFTTSH